jgi:hypothetical protein
LTLIIRYSGAAKINTEESKRLMIATIRALNFWHNHFREDFRFNPEVIVKLREFEDLVKNDGLENFLKIDQTADDRWGRSNSLKTPQHHIIRRPSLGFDSIPPEELSEILGSLDYKLFRRIPVSLSIHSHTRHMTPYDISHLNIRKLFSLFGSFPRHEFPLMML